MRALVLCALAVMPALPAAASCRLALALALDVSGSVDAREYELQRGGLARALTAPAVREALLAFPGAWVDLSIYEWSGLDAQKTLIDWTTIRAEADIAGIAAVLTAPGYRPRQAETALGMALLDGGKRMARRTGCLRRVLDVSSDGRSNVGPSPRSVRARGALDGVTVNALVIGVAPAPAAGGRSDTIGALSAYYRAEVIQGEDAFVQTAVGYQDYRMAMERKLLRELDVRAITWALP